MALIAAAVLGVFIVVAAIVITVRTQHGEVVIELNDPTAKVAVQLDRERVDGERRAKSEIKEQPGTKHSSTLELRKGMVFEGTKTWTKIGAVVPPGTVRRIRLTITEVDGGTFKAVFSSGDLQPTTWSWKATGEYGSGKIKWSDDGGAVAEGTLDAQGIDFDSGNGVGKMKLVVRP